MILEIFFISLIDSLNPITIIALFFLLAQKNPLKSSSVFIVGIFSTYFIGGILILLGLYSAIEALFANPTISDYILQLIIGILILYYTIKSFNKSENAKPKITNLGLVPILLLSIGVTLSDFPTALPYFAAINLIISKNFSTITSIAYLSFYNIIYIFPLLTIIALFLAKKKQILSFFEKNKEIIILKVTKISNIFIILIGIVLSIDAILFMLGFKPIL